MRHQYLFHLFKDHPLGNRPMSLLIGASDPGIQLVPGPTAKCVGAIMGGGKKVRLFAFIYWPVNHFDKTYPSSHIGSKRSIWNSLFNSVPDIHPGDFRDWDPYCRGES